MKCLYIIHHETLRVQDVLIILFRHYLYINIVAELADIKEKIRQCLEEIKSWMLENFMKLNQAKTELLVFGSKRVLKKTQGLDLSISFGDTVIHDCSDYVYRRRYLIKV